MKINHIRLKNFRSYYGEQTLSFTIDVDRHVTVIHGANGAGKTSLFIAFNWCFYGTGFVQEKFGNIGRLENGRAVREDSSAETMVEIGFSYRGNQYCISRSKIGSDETTLLSSNNTFGLKRKYFDDDADERIRLIFPESVSIHFFFDGEQIYNFTKPGNEEEIKHAVRNVLRIEDINRGFKHLTDIASEYRRELNQRSTGNLKKLRDEMKNLESKRSKLEKNIERDKEEIAAAEKLKQKIDARLLAIASARSLAEERNSIEKELQGMNRDRLDKLAEIRDLANKGFYPLTKPAILRSLEIIKKNDAPSSIPKAYLKELLNQTRCLCGRPITHNSIEYNNIVKLLNIADASETKFIVGETQNKLEQLLNEQVKNIPIQLQSTLNDLQEFESKIQAKETRLEKIKEKLGNFKDEEINQLEEARKRHESEIRELEDKITLTKGRIEEINNKISELDTEINKEEELNAATEQLSRHYRLTNSSANAMEKIYEMHASNMREKIQEEVGPIFKGLIKNADHFTAITLKENYKLVVVDALGDDVLPEMSAGQRQVLSLSFIGALAKMAIRNMLPNLENEPFPIVMDTPFCRLSTEHRETIADVFPEIADQLVLFVTDEELHGEARTKLESWIGAEYKLEFTREDEKNTTTTITRIPRI